MSYLMALDQGTTSCRCILFNQNCEIVSISSEELLPTYPKNGWVEHDPMKIWETQLKVSKKALNNINATFKDIDSIGITNQRETTILWNKLTGKPIYNAIVWQCRRTSRNCDLLKENHMETIKDKTGLVIDAYFSATKIKWILDNVEGAREEAEKGNILFGTVDTWLIWNLTKGEVFATDYTNASRTMLYNIHTLEWDKELLELFDIPINILPKVLPSSHIYGETDKSHFGGNIKIGGVGGDQHCALFGQGCFNKGMIKNTYGTGCFILMNTGETPIISNKGLITTIAWAIDNKITYAQEGSIFIGGAVIQWLRDGMEMIKNAKESESYINHAKDCNGLYVVPAFVGLGAPYWSQEARGIVVGITRDTTKAQFIRASLEAIAYQSNSVIDVMKEEFNVDVKEVRVDGGASNNDFLMQFQADISEVLVTRPQVTESTALGSILFSGLATGYFKSLEDISSKIKIDKTFTNSMDFEKRRTLLRGWEKAVKTAILWGEDD
ncbi:MAG: glycerol kinase GlpK [Lachnospirales bacterium]